MFLNLDEKKQLLESILKPYRSGGSLPSLRTILRLLENIHPQELAQALYVLEYRSCKAYLGLWSSIADSKDYAHFFSSREIKKDHEKLLMAIGEHFRRVPKQASDAVDQIFRYFYRALVLLSLKQGWMGTN